MSESSMGAYLRDARRRRRVSIDRAAEQTRIRPDYLMRMESDEFDFLAPAYVRGFLRTYARFLRVNEEPLIDEFDRKFGRNRADTTAIAALETRAKSVPRQRRPLNSWTLAAVLAAVTLVALAVVGIVNAPEEPRAPANDTGNVAEDEPSPEPAESTTPPPSPTTTPTEEEDPTVALAEGIELEVVAANGDCWMDVTADGENIYSETLPAGESVTFDAEDSMDIVLGLPASVELIVNGQNIGSPGGADVVTLKLPEDIDTF
ncbi:MAG: helix-turn-helix domain-containing protein [Actinomycetota bacterium]